MKGFELRNIAMIALVLLLASCGGNGEKKAQNLDASSPAPESENASEPKVKKGLFRGGFRRKNALPNVEFGTKLPYGEFARVCGTKDKRKLGKKVEESNDRAGSYALYDSAPNSTKPRTFYLTGFKDRCPRQFTASLAVLSSVANYERLRLLPPSKLRIKSKTDEAYRKARKPVCKAAKEKPCSEKEIAKLERSIFFLTTYESFGSAARWSEVVFHKGKVLSSNVQKH